MGRRGRQKTLPFTGLIVSTVSSTSYTTAAWQTGWTARHKHRQMHAGPVLQPLTFMREKKKLHTERRAKAFACDDLQMGNAAILHACSAHITHARTYVCTHHSWVTGSLVAPQPLYLDKLISRFKALSLKNSFHGFLIDARWSSVFYFQHGGKRLNGWAGGGGHKSFQPSFSSTWGTWRCSPGRGGFLIPAAWLWVLHEVEVDGLAPPLPARMARSLASSSNARFRSSDAASRHPRPHLSHHTALFVHSFFETPISPSVSQSTIHQRNLQDYSKRIVQ